MARNRRLDSSDSDSSSEEEERRKEDEEEHRHQEDMDSWVQCDKCTKWRRIPASVAEQLRDDQPWYCEHNPDLAKASCDVAQELTNEQIDALNEDEEEFDEGLEEERGRRRRIPAVWQLIRDNIFLNRKRKQQEEDDVMICQCKPVWRGGDGCGPDCINRMLCIECVAGFCPCEDKCTNQAFTLKQYAKLEVRRAGAKGFGLFALEDIKRGQFIIEYIGEVLDEEEYLRRKDFYAEVGQRHYYFMNIGNGEVIDACRKGNRARFINHACDPNCETQKWLARGELAIGLFATKDISAEEELTFDYNFERYGDKPIRCYCGSRTCRRFIGGVQDSYVDNLVADPDDASNDFQPVMLTDADMDWATRSVLDWRVGVAMDKDKEGEILGRLERICRSRGIPWQPGHYYGALSVPMPTADTNIADVPDIGMDMDDTRLLPDVDAEIEKPAKPKPARSASLVSRKKATGSAGSAVPMVGVVALTSKVEEIKPVKVEGESSIPRGPLKAAFKQMKIKEQSVHAELGAVLSMSERKLAASVVGPKADALAAVKAGAARRRLHSTGSKAAEAAATATSTIGSAAASRLHPIEPGLSSSALSAATAEAKASSAGAPTSRRRPLVSMGGRNSVRRRSEIDRRLDVLVNTSGRLKEANKQNIIKVLRMFNLCDIGPQRVAMRPVPEPQHTPGLPEVLGPSGQDTRPVTEQDSQQPTTTAAHLSATDGRASIAAVSATPAVKEEASEVQHPGSRADAAGLYDDAVMGPVQPVVQTAGILAALRDPSSANQPVVITARQRARMADLSLLLDVILKTSSATIKKDFVACGVLNQLQQAIGRNFSKEYSVILRKILRVMESLPLTADDIHGVRTAHGTFYNVLQELASNQDYDVRTKAAVLCKKFPHSACTDPALVQPHRRGQTGFSPAGGQGLPPQPGWGRGRGGPGGDPSVPGRVPRTNSQDQIMADGVGPDGVGLPPLGPQRAGRPMRAMHMRTVSGDLPGHGPQGVAMRPVSPALTPGQSALGGPARSTSPGMGEPQASSHDQQGQDQQGLVHPDGHQTKRRRSGFSAPAEPLGTAGPAGQSAPLPYSYRHGSALGVKGEEPPPPPLDAEELYELLEVPIVIMERTAGYKHPRPPVFPPPPQGDQPPHGVHGEGTDMECLYAVGVYDMDWLEWSLTTMPSRRSRKSSRERERDWDRRDRRGGSREEEVEVVGGVGAGGAEGQDERPMSPISAPEVYSPFREDMFVQEVEAERAWQQRQAQIQAQQRQMMMMKGHGRMPTAYLHPPGVGVGGSTGSSGQQGAAMPLIMDLRASASRQPSTPSPGLAVPVQDIHASGGQYGQRTLPPSNLGWQGAPDAPTPSSHHPTPSAATPMPIMSSMSQWESGMLQATPGPTGFSMPPIASLSAATPTHQGHGGPPGDSSMQDAWAGGQPPRADHGLTDADAAEWARPMPLDYPETWDEPDDSFESFVSETVRYRLGKYVTQPDHHTRVSSEDAHVLYRKIRREVVDKERAAYEQRCSQSLFKLIEKRKVEHNLREFVRLSIRRYHTQQTGAPPPG